MNAIKALVVDDTIVYRKIIGDTLKQIPGIEVVGTASNGKIALSKIKTLKPDLMTLDIEMPEMNGIELLQELQNMDSPPLVIMVSTQTHQGGELTLRALELGAFEVLSKLEVLEAKDGDIIEPGKVFIAPGGKQMKIAAGADGLTRKIKITDDPPGNSCKPSADYLFRSIAQHYVGRATGVIMTGMGSDGSKGLVQMKNSGSFIIAQDEKTCTVYGMPKKTIESGIVDVIASLEKIAAEIVKTV